MTILVFSPFNVILLLQVKFKIDIRPFHCHPHCHHHHHTTLFQPILAYFCHFHRYVLGMCRMFKEGIIRFWEGERLSLKGIRWSWEDVRWSQETVRPVLFCDVLFCSVNFCVIKFCSVQCCFVLCYCVLFCSVLYLYSPFSKNVLESQPWWHVTWAGVMLAM